MSIFKLIRTVNNIAISTIRYLCVSLLVLMTGFIIYTIIMRYVFLDPPFWGDTLAVFANIWLVLMAFPLAVYDREHIAMQGMYDMFPHKVTVIFHLVWDFVILAMGIFMVVYGMELVNNIRGSYHELGGLPKKWPVMILPVFGFLTIFAALAPITNDIARLRDRKNTR